jgi:hypothetical protein
VKNAYDLRLLEDKLHLGRALHPLIERFVPSGNGRDVPAGRIWEALEELRHFLEQEAVDQLAKPPDEMGRFAALIARLLGKPTAAAPGGSGDELAYFRGRRDGMHRFLQAIMDFNAAAIEADAAASLASKKQAEKKYSSMRVGQSPM